MRTAILEATERISKQSVRIELRYYYWSSNRWSCLPGYLKVSKGYWISSGITDTLYFYDDDDNVVAFCHDMDLQNFGYPFDGLDGDTGPFWAALGGMLAQGVTWWRLLDV